MTHPPLCKGRFSGTCIGGVHLTCVDCGDSVCGEHYGYIFGQVVCWLCRWLKPRWERVTIKEVDPNEH